MEDSDEDNVNVFMGSKPREPRKRSRDDGIEIDPFMKNLERDDEESESEASEENEHEEEEEDDDVDLETVDERRIRLAKEYIKKLKQVELEIDGGTNDLVADQLKRDALESEGKSFRSVANELQNHLPSIKTNFYKSSSKPLTCVAIDYNEKYAYTGTKEGNIIKWDLETGKRVWVVYGNLHRKNTSRKRKQEVRNEGRRKKKLLAIGDVAGAAAFDKSKQTHFGQIYAIAISHDGRYLATGGQDRRIVVRNPENGNFIEFFEGHRAAVSGLVFRAGSHQLFSTSFDSTVKVWDLSVMSYQDTLYGHQREVMAVDCLMKERCVTTGIDNTCRVWKIEEESQLVFRGPTESIDCISLIDENRFVTGSQDGSLSLWLADKKKPLSKTIAHFTDSCCWVSSVSAMKYTDLIASGGSDGFLRFWKVNFGKKNFTQIGSLKLPGFINGIAIGKGGRKLVAAVGQEHRLGRWYTNKESKNGILVVDLSLEDEVKKLLKAMQEPSDANKNGDSESEIEIGDGIPVRENVGEDDEEEDGLENNFESIVQQTKAKAKGTAKGKAKGKGKGKAQTSDIDIEENGFEHKPQDFTAISNERGEFFEDYNNKDVSENFELNDNKQGGAKGNKAKGKGKGKAKKVIDQFFASESENEGHDNGKSFKDNNNYQDRDNDRSFNTNGNRNNRGGFNRGKGKRMKR